MCWILINNDWTKRLLYPKIYKLDTLWLYWVLLSHYLYTVYLYTAFMDVPVSRAAGFPLFFDWLCYSIFIGVLLLVYFQPPPLSHILTTPRLQVISWSLRKIAYIRWLWGRYNTCVNATPSDTTLTIKRRLVRWTNERWTVWLGTN